jgi:glucuronoarabinoxylan endo-1,4-beta-xylanase
VGLPNRVPFVYDPTMKTQTPATVLSLALVAVASSAQAAEVTVDRSTTYQTIDGFGFFGAHDVWWGSAADMVNEDWVRLVIDDLGLTLWRNEYFPPSDDLNGQDADWEKQRPVVELFRDVAQERKVPLKVLLSIWTPPASMKCAVSDNGVIDESTAHPGGTKDGGALCPSRRDDFAAWLIEGLRLYADVGVDVHGMSFQNEPLFVEPYNSCVYTQSQYVETLAAIAPAIKAAFPDVKLFGSENMLEIECGKSDAGQFDPWWYTGNLLEQPDALDSLDVFAVHGYSDGVNATPTSKMATLWSEYEGAIHATGKPVWMTETSGYGDGWEATADLPGAIDLAQGIYAALKYGHASAWVWWQGSELDGPSEYGLMAGTEVLSKRYYVSKQFYRYIRPGARRVEAKSNDDDALIVAFEHPEMGALTLVAINVGTRAKDLTLTGSDLPASFDVHRSSEAEDCEDLGAVAADAIVLPPRSVTTLVSGNVFEDQADGTGGTDGAGGSESGGAWAAGAGGGEAGGTAAGGHASGGRPAGGSSSGGRAAGGHAAGGSSGGKDSGDAGEEGLVTGGSLGSGGARSSGGAPGLAGATSAAGTSANAAAGSSAESTSDSKDGGGCGCGAAGAGRSAGAWWLLFAAFLARVSRRRRSGARGLGVGGVGRRGPHSGMGRKAANAPRVARRVLSRRDRYPEAERPEIGDAARPA